MWRLLYIVVFGLGFVGCWYSQQATNPEQLIIGNWKELTWQYEEKDRLEADSINEKNVTHIVTEELKEDLFIHKGETWSFLSNGYLKITRGSEPRHVVRWRIKGRGHILQLIYYNGERENYLLTELSENKMTIDYEAAVQAKGIASLTFQRSKS